MILLHYIVGVSLFIVVNYKILLVYHCLYSGSITIYCRCIAVYRDSVAIYRRDRDLVDGPVTGAGQCCRHGSLLVGYDRF